MTTLNDIDPDALVIHRCARCGMSMTVLTLVHIHWDVEHQGRRLVKPDVCRPCAAVLEAEQPE